jgi:hypothetical protein
MGILQPELQALGQAPGRRDVGLGELVADAPAAGVQHDPHPAPLVQAELEEVVAGAEGPELLGRPLGLVGGQVGRRPVGRQPPVRVAGRPTVALAHPGRDRRRDPAEQGFEGVRELGVGHVELGGDHPAADVDPDRRRDDRALGGDDRPDGRAEPDVGVGHEGDVAVDDRQPGRLLGLADGPRIDVAGPGDELVVDRGRHVTSSAVARSCVPSWLLPSPSEQREGCAFRRPGMLVPWPTCCG